MRKISFLLIILAVTANVKAQSWNLSGNAGTNGAIHFIGTTDAQPLFFRVNNIRAGQLNLSNYNTSFGMQALLSSTEGSANTALGTFSLYSNSSGYLNTGTGMYSLYSNTTGAYNSATGVYALFSNTTASNNTAAGAMALYGNTTGYNNTANGYQALYTNSTGYYNTADGYQALYSNTSGHHNIAIGTEVLKANTTGTYNTAGGYSSLTYNTTGSSNTSFGGISLWNNTTGGANTAFGYGALSQSNGEGNTATGYEALYSNSSGSSNTANGFSSLFTNSGSYNTALGAMALRNNNNAYYNTCVGYQAGDSYRMGWNNVLLGANTDVNTTDRYNCIAIGQDIILTANNQARIGNPATNSIGGYVGWTNLSDGRYKKDVQQNVKGLDFIMKLQPVTYHLDIAGLDQKLHEGIEREPNKYEQIAMKEKEKILYSGFVAQDVEKAAKETGYDFSGVDKPKEQNDLYGLRYAEFVVPLVKAVQEQQQMIDELRKQNADLLKRVGDLEKRNGILSPATEELLVWPNPSYDKVFMNITATSASSAVIKLFDSKGALVKQQTASIITGNNQLSIDINTLSKGMYVLSAEWSNGKIKKTAQVIK